MAAAARSSVTPVGERDGLDGAGATLDRHPGLEPLLSGLRRMHSGIHALCIITGLDPVIHEAFDFNLLGEFSPLVIMDHRIKSGGDAEFGEMAVANPRRAAKR
ncbi:hypothetical protein [Rhodobium gokarnense]|uniref:Uncharacterized protein n=1 Tax=Rhodobium gokarnense TaxID=364296 RepID=A0ABT3HDZ4_9HYPH|nr:hypothetical protein [Rhodobium gokarnense]MCW2308622.1 hypothetical protein [Rhodobium gokarnense]